MGVLMPYVGIVFVTFAVAYAYSSLESNEFDVPSAIKYAFGASVCGGIGFWVMFWPGAVVGLFLGLCGTALLLQCIEPMFRSFFEALRKD